MKKILLFYIVFASLFIGFQLVPINIYAQSKYSVDKKIERRKHRPTKQERYENRAAKKMLKKQDRKKKKAHKSYSRTKKRYARNVAGSGKELSTGRKVRKRMKRSKKVAKRNNS